MDELGLLFIERSSAQGLVGARAIKCEAHVYGFKSQAPSAIENRRTIAATAPMKRRPGPSSVPAYLEYAGVEFVARAAARSAQLRGCVVAAECWQDKSFQRRKLRAECRRHLTCQ